jgi:uncharacterized protein YodC (DUF2158 family)
MNPVVRRPSPVGNAAPTTLGSIGTLTVKSRFKSTALKTFCEHCRQPGNDLAGCAWNRSVSTQEPEPGDEVVLRTGGPVVAVLESDDDRPRELFCVWFDEQRRRRQGIFHSDLLILVELSD